MGTFFSSCYRARGAGEVGLERCFFAAQGLLSSGVLGALLGQGPVECIVELFTSC